MLASILENRWVPSARVSLKISGLYFPAAGLSVPAESLGAFGSPASPLGQGPPPGAAEIAKLDSGKASPPSGALQGMRSVSVV